MSAARPSVRPRVVLAPLAGVLLALAACGDSQDVGAAELTFDGGRLDAAVEAPADDAGGATPTGAGGAGAPGSTDANAAAAAAGLTAAGAAQGGPEDAGSTPGTPSGDPEDPWERGETGLPILTWDGMLLEDDRVDDLLDSLIYPDEYTEEERAFPEELAALDGEEVEIHGYMIPLEWEGEKVRELMLVGDVLACCFGGAPEPDQWVDVLMVGEGAEYYMQLPIVCRGTFTVEGIADEAGYAAGCYVLKCTSLELAE